MGTSTDSGYHPMGIGMAFDCRPMGTLTDFGHRPMGIGMAFDCRPMANQDTYRRGIADHYRTETGYHPMDKNQNYRPKQDRLRAETEMDTGA